MDCSSKVKYSSKQFADADIKRISKISTRSKVPVRAYLCECGSWHLTSKALNYGKKNDFELKLTELTKEYDEMVDDYNQVLDELEELKLKNQSLCKAENKMDRVSIKSDKRVQELTTQCNRMRDDNKRIRADRDFLIANNSKLQHMCDALKAHNANIIDKVIELINNYWSFTNTQQHTHTWHSKQDCLEKIYKLKS